MANELIINVTHQETRVALLEDRVLAELYIERAKDRGIVGNIYKGKVVKVLPGMQAAFVDVGLEKASFLYVSDVYGGVEDYEEIGFQGGGDAQLLHPSPRRSRTSFQKGRRFWCRFRRNPSARRGLALPLT